MNIARHLEQGARFFPHHPVISEAGVETSYRALDAQANAVARGLVRLGVREGERMGLCAPNSREWLAFYFGVLKVGAVAVTFSPLLKPQELEAMVRYAGPRYVFGTEALLGGLEPLCGEGLLTGRICPGGELPWEALTGQGEGAFEARPRNPWDPAAVLFTGGTTGIAKGVLLTHEAILVSSHNVAWCERSTEKDRSLCFLPFNHVFGQIHIMNATVFSGGCLELLPAFDPDRVLHALGSGAVTKFYAVPTVYSRFLNLDNLSERLGKVRYCFSAAASLAAEIVRAWKERTGLNIAEGYGLTETASAVTYNHVFAHRIGSVGQEVPGVEVEIRDLEGRPVERGQEGEICIRGRNVMAGYLDHPEETRAAFWPDRWFRSGDIGVLDPDGYLSIVDRLKDMIITGGENVYPREIEELLYTRGEIQECAVLGLPDKEWGERVIAFIVPKPGQDGLPVDLRPYLKERLAAYKVPKAFVLVEEIPKSGAGKILKRELKRQYGEAGPRAAFPGQDAFTNTMQKEEKHS